MTGLIRTVLGDVAAKEFGHTQTHEHLLADLSQPLPETATPEQRARDEAPITLANYYATRREHTSQDLRLESIEDASDELKEYKEAGGSAVVDATSIGLRRDPDGLRTISERTGVHVVMGSGYYYRDYHPADLDTMSARDVEDGIIADLTVGVGERCVRAGVIGEIGLSWPHHPVEERVLRASVGAQQKTGAALLIHPARHPSSPFQAMKLVEQAGGDPSRVIMSHVDRTLFTDEEIQELAGTGCFVEFDLFGQEMSFYSLGNIDMPNDATRIDHIDALFQAGFGEQVLISQDICHKTNLRRFGGEGYTHILRHVLPQMRVKGLSDEQIDVMTVANPRRALALNS